MDILNTRVFMVLLSFLQSLWSDTFGKIFVLTLIAYSTSYMVYSGYISWFSGGYGGFLLSQVGFTPIDFLSFIPTIFALIIRSLGSLIKFFIKLLFNLFLLPLVIAIIVMWILFHLGIHFLAGNTSLGLFGILVWYLCIFAWTLIEITGIQYKKYLRHLVALSAISVFLWFLGFSYGTNNSITIPFLRMQTTYSSSPNILSEIMAIFYIITILVFPFIIGLLLAALAVRENYLSQLLKISLKKPIEIPGAISEINKTTSPQKKNWFQPPKED